MNITVALLCLLTGSLVIWMLLSIFRHPRDLSELLKRIEPARADRLCTFVETRITTIDYQGSDLWSALGGLKGLREIHRECSILLMLAIQFAHQYPHEAKTDELEGLFMKCIYLRPLVWMCLCEELARRQFICLPRMQAYALAKLYCDIFDTIEAIRCLPLAEAS